MFDSVVDLLGNLSPAVASLNENAVAALRAEDSRRPGPSPPEERAGRSGSGSAPPPAVPGHAGAGSLAGLRRLLERLDPAVLDEAGAVALHDFFVEGERLMAAGRAMAARALESSGVWRRQGFRSAAAWSAAQAGLPSGPSIRARETLGLLDDLPLASAALRAGRLSLAQALAIADAASEWPQAEAHLVATAETLSLAGLQEECQRVRAAVLDEADRQRRVRRGRFCRTWRDRDGAFRLSARMTVDEGARLAAALDARRDEIVAEAKAGGWYENPDIHRADALAELGCVSGPGGRPAPTVHVWVDYDALTRGYVVDGERCEIPGLGPIPVGLVRQMATDCILKVIVTRGVEITAVAHAGRTIPAHLRTALECRDPVCIVPGCEARRNLEIDHRAPWSATRDTSLGNLARLCRFHHFQKTFLGYRYRGGPGHWQWVPPDEPTEPPDAEASTSRRPLRC